MYILTFTKIECGPMPNVMAALRNIDGSNEERKFTNSVKFLVTRRKVWLTHTARVSSSNAANIGERKT